MTQIESWSIRIVDNSLKEKPQTGFFHSCILFQSDLRVLALGQDEAGGSLSCFIVLDLPSVPNEGTDFRVVAVPQGSALSWFSLEIDPFEDDALLA